MRRSSVRLALTVPRLSLVPVLSLALAACGDPSVTIPDAGASADAAVGPAPDRPRVEAAPSRVPYAVLTLRGRSSARRVIVEGAGNPIASTVLPDETFCVDVTLPAPGDYALRVIAQGLDGQLSDAAGPIAVTYDPAAPAVPNAVTCTGSDPAGCPGAREICGNGRDDDCNNLTDDRDPACSTCTDDVLEPNDTVGAPRIEPGRYDDLKICPANQDYYGVSAKVNDQVSIRIFFVSAQGDLDLDLLGTDKTHVVARSTSVTDDESITYTATTAGQYMIRVYGYEGASNTYALDLRVTSP